jgi:hypothetical protein
VTSNNYIWSYRTRYTEMASWCSPVRAAWPGSQRQKRQQYLLVYIRHRDASGAGGDRRDLVRGDAGAPRNAYVPRGFVLTALQPVARRQGLIAASSAWAGCNSVARLVPLLAGSAADDFSRMGEGCSLVRLQAGIDAGPQCLFKTAPRASSARRAVPGQAPQLTGPGLMRLER